MPERIQRTRLRNWRMPDDAVYVGRPTVWANPFKVVRLGGNRWGVTSSTGDDRLAGSWYTKFDASEQAVALYRQHRLPWILRDNPVAVLRGHDLACWCPLEDDRGRPFPCHADLLLQIANPRAFRIPETAPKLNGGDAA